MKLYFVRHGETSTSAEGLHQFPDDALSQKGEEQAAFIAKRFSTIPIGKILASPFRRAEQTALAIQSAKHAPLVTMDSLREIKRPSEVEGKSKKDAETRRIKTEIGDHYLEPGWHFSDEENFSDVCRRAMEFIGTLADLREEHVAVVSHGYLIKVITALLVFGGECPLEMVQRFVRRTELAQTGLTVFSRDEKDKWILETFNDVSHLGEM